MLCGRLLSGVLIVLAWNVTALAELKWEASTVTVRAKATDADTVAEYRFTNSGEREIRIEEVRTSCGCASPEYDKQKIGPGKSGVVRVKIRLGKNVGSIQRTVVVTSSDLSLPVYELVARVQIEDPVTPSRRTITWDDPDAPPVSVRLRRNLPSIVKLGQLEVSGKGLKAEVVASTDDYIDLKVYPWRTDSASVGTIKVIVVIGTAAIEKEILLRVVSIHAAPRVTSMK